MTTSGKAAIRVGILGLGGAAVSVIPKIARNSHFTITAAADIDQEILDRFKRDFPDAVGYTDAQAMCDSKEVDLVYIATPNRLHSEHARMALEGGKHVLIEKPMTITLPDADAMIATAEQNGVLLGVNVKHSFEPRILKLRELARTGDLGKLRMVNHWRYQDWLYRPRTPEELTPEWGGGILWRQGPHQFDLLRTIGGGLMRSVRGSTGTWDPRRRVPGAHTAYFEFEDGACGTAVYSGYDHFTSGEFVYGFDPDEPSDGARYAEARRDLESHGWDVAWETGQATAERYGGGRQGGMARPARAAGHSGGWILGGPLVASFDRADVRFSPRGLRVYGDDKQWEIDLPGPEDGRDGRLNTYYDAIVNGTPLAADGRWGKATLEVLLAVEQSGKERREIFLEHQTPTVDELT